MKTCFASGNEWMLTAPMSESTERTWHQFNRRRRLRGELQVTDPDVSASYKIKSPGFFIRKAGFTGWIDEVQIWNKALSDEEVLQCMKGYYLLQVIRKNSLLSSLQLIKN